jgi:hypothetical protein
MLEIAKLNGKTSNNSARLVIAALAISVARLIATTLIILVVAALLKLAALAVPVIVAPFKRSACKAIRGRAASSAS